MDKDPRMRELNCLYDNEEVPQRVVIQRSSKVLKSCWNTILNMIETGLIHATFVECISPIKLIFTTIQVIIWLI